MNLEGYVQFEKVQGKMKNLNERSRKEVGVVKELVHSRWKSIKVNMGEG